MSYKDIQEKCQLSDRDLKDAMMRLCNPKTQVLKKENAKKPVFEPNEMITVNPKFENNNIRLNLVPVVSAAQLAQGAGGTRSVEEVDVEVQKERAMIIDAVCVRIMKGRKVEKHQELIQAIIHQVNMF